MDQLKEFTAPVALHAALDIAVVIPCCNEETAIAGVVGEFRNYLPTAKIYVYDNNSTDNTVEEASRAGAIVRCEPRQGKGSVVRRMFADVEADVYLMVDGDDTYDATRAAEMVNTLIEGGLDMVNGARREVSEVAYRRGHRLGNRLLTRIVKTIFGDEYRDMLSGYRAFSRRFVKSFPVMSAGFEIETELTIHALELEMPSAEILTDYKNRPEGSESKLKTYTDGLRILMTIAKLLKQERPVLLFSVVGSALGMTALALMYPILMTYLETGLVPRFPTAILATGLGLAALLSFVCGLILDTVTRGRKELKRMFYLTIPGVLAAGSDLNKLRFSKTFQRE